ncbi:MAG: sugar phosphate isomerase/epimerase [Cytophagia bacterium]|nr:sugar phosphate isomerase/epimerase [Cytophagia bacterium]
MENRRSFLKKTVMAGAAISLSPNLSAGLFDHEEPLFSLAQWSLHKALQSGEMAAKDFPFFTKKEFGINTVEYVNQFYANQKSNTAFWSEILNKTNGEGIKNLLIMVDAEGELGNANKRERKKAVENHHGWVDIAAKMGCHSIRVNAFGAEDKAQLKSALVDGLGSLCEYSQQAKINVLIENHGLYSSDADFIVEVIKEVNNPFMGTLPDFGNWCTSQMWGSTDGDGCQTAYNHVEGVKKFLPYAKGVSAKTYNFDTKGNQPNLDYKAMLKVVKDAGYQGHIGIEYEGSNLSEVEGIKASKKLIESIWSEL